MRHLENRVAIVTGAGRGLGRSYARLMAREGARVVVNDLGTSTSGVGGEQSPAEDVVREILAEGGKAAASHHDVSDWHAAGHLVSFAIDTFGRLDVLVNNAGILRDRTLANISEAEWDAVIDVHLKGYAATTHHAMAYWRYRAKSGAKVRASSIHTTSISGLAGNFGQANYAAAKLGIVALSRVAALEGASFGVRSNAVAPSARTRLAMSGTPNAEALFERPAIEGEFDHWDPDNVAPIIAWLAREDCPATSQIFHVLGRSIRVFSMPSIVHELVAPGRWTMEALDRELTPRLAPATSMEQYLELPK